MKQFTVVFHPDAETDIATSYEWGRRTWGEKKAQAWARQLQRTIKAQLATFPARCALAPESEELGVAVRQLVVGRYRVLFIIQKKTVTIMHVRGAYVADLETGEETE